jgi:membrane protein implicated in regulation of membrane protease activity
MALVMTLAWIGLAIVAIAVEVVATSFIFLFVAVAALVAAGLAALTMGLPLQLVAFALLALLLPVLLRRQLVQRFSGRGIPSRTDVLIGATGEVTEAVDPVRGTGRVVVNGQDWAARSSGPVPAGAKVEVVEADGIVLIVRQPSELRSGARL